MHELALAEGVLGAVLDIAGDQKIRKISLQVGILQFVEDTSMQFAFQLLAEETNASQATLELQQAPAIFRCRTCGEESSLHTPPFQCQACSGFQLDCLSGDQILIYEIYLEDGSVIRRPGASVTEALEEHIKNEHGSNREQTGSS